MNRAKDFGLVILSILATFVFSGCPSGKKVVLCGPPIASAGDDIEGVTGQRLILHGSFRLPPEDEFACQAKLDGVSFHWEQISGPDLVLDGAEQVEASFVPVEAGEYSFRCKAIFSESTDPSRKESQWDTVKVIVSERTCGPPVADAGQDQLLGIEHSPVRVQLDGSRSQPAQSCPDLDIVRYSWTLEQIPAGSNASINTEQDAAKAWFDADLPGDYSVRLEVQDSMEEQGRVSTDDAVVIVKVLERTPCEQTLDVEVTSEDGGLALGDVHVIVVDSQGVSHEGITDATGMVHMDSLAPGSRQSITVSSEEKVTALAGTGDESERNRYQTVSILDQCSSSIHIPMPLTDSGRAAKARGMLVGRVPQTLFDALPHSQKYAGVCSSDADCKTGYVCKPTNMGDQQCTPISLLPVFGIDDPNISGQFRGVLLTAVQAEGSLPDFPVNALFAPPVSADAILPGNLATDDAFLNSLGPLLGTEVWGDACSTVADCPNTTQYSCENNGNGEIRCKDLRPLTNIQLSVPSGQSVGLVMTLAIVNVGMENLIPILSAMLDTSSEGVDFDVGSLLGAFQVQTLYVCPLKVKVAPGVKTDISSAIGSIDPKRDCWAVPYQQKETIVAVPDKFSIRSDNECKLDSDCGWPDSGLRCLAPDGTETSQHYCLIPLYRVSLISEQQVQLAPSSQAMDPASPNADERVCSWLPGQASHPKQCAGPDGRPETCDPPEQCVVDTPVDTSCSMPYGLAIVTADLPDGHQYFSEGGRIVLGFRFNVSPLSSDATPSFLVPSLETMGATKLGAVQKYFRNIFWMPDKTYQLLPGMTSAAQVTSDDVRSMILPAFPFFSGLQGDALDAGMDVEVWFDPKDPTASCQSMDYERTWATATSLIAPSDQQHQSFKAELSLSALPDGHLAMLEIAKVDRVDPDQDGDLDSLVDRQWLVFVPSSARDITLPMQASPFSSGDEIRLQVINADLGVAYDHDLFPTELIMHGQTAVASDAFELLVP